MKSTNWAYYQPNKKDVKDKYGDCVIRALCKATNKEWLEVFDELIPYARRLQCQLDEKEAWGEYLTDNGYKWHGVKVEKGKSRPTPQTFCKEYKKGTYVLRTAHHVITVKDGKFYDTWDSGKQGVYGYYKQEG